MKSTFTFILKYIKIIIIIISFINIYIIFFLFFFLSFTLSLLLGFSSSTSNFCQSLFSEGIREIITSESKILFREVENVYIIN